MTTETATAPQGAEIAALAEAQVLLPVYPHLDFEPVAASGVWLETGEGRRILDLYGGHAVALLGYGHPPLGAALRQQADSLTFQSNVVALSLRARTAERLIQLAPAGLEKIFLVNSGAEANENALRVAQLSSAPGRQRVLALEGSFHGRTAAAGAVTHGARQKWYGFPQLPFPVTFVPRDDPAALDRELGDDVAALIVEPIQGVAGAVDLGPRYLNTAREMTAARGIRLIFDEVQCGMGRTGYPFAADHYGVTPDILTTAKGLAAGFPAGALWVNEEVAAAVQLGALGSTFGGGPLACAAIGVVLDALAKPELLQRVRRLSARLRSECLGLGPVVGVQGAGYLLGLRTDRPAKEVQTRLLEAGILVGTSADPFVVRLMPPLILEDDHVDRLLSALAEFPVATVHPTVHPKGAGRPR